MSTAGPEHEQAVSGGHSIERYYTVAQAARTLQVHRTTILRWIDAGRLRAYRVGPKALRIMKRDLEAAITPANEKLERVKDMKEQERPWSATATRAPALSLTDDEIERGLAALRRLRAFREAIAARHGGPVLPPSEELIRKEREERSKRL